ncbi:MAG TPA: carboxymuconolactone decarboxylase family protein [Acetobacteraceae bacterium]|nr:carboxymuconolactone decarboxylase family protein [Acetobacteraceae bacterium]
MSGTSRAEQGRAIRRRLMGDAYADRIDKAVYDDPIMRKFGEIAVENVFGGLWTRPGLDVKTRTLICVISDTVMGREAELAIHLRMARREGWSEDELVEALLHLSGYCGLPLVREALLVARKVFGEMRAEAETR